MEVIIVIVARVLPPLVLCILSGLYFGIDALSSALFRAGKLKNRWMGGGERIYSRHK